MPCPTDREYARRCAAVNVLRRRVVERTAHLIRPQSPEVALFVRGLLRSPVVEKPPLHRGGRDTDWLELALAPDQVETVSNALLMEMFRNRAEGAMFLGERAELWDVWESWDPLWRQACHLHPYFVPCWAMTDDEETGTADS